MSTAARQSRNPNVTPELPTCNSGSNQDWGKGVESYFFARQWGELNRGCVSTIFGAGADEGVVIQTDDITKEAPKGWSSRQVYDAVLEHAKTMNESSLEVASAIGGDWDKFVKEKRVNRGWNYQYSTRAQSCSHDYVGFVKREGKWYVTERITNLDPRITAEENGRLYIHEYVRVGEDEKLQGAWMGLREEGTEQEGPWRNSTTALRIETGSVTASEFAQIFQPNNPAVDTALKSGSHQTQQASDATTPSNIAILALPLAMNLVPVALIADVNSFGMLVYTLLTDVLTTIPLAIKGVEVITIGASSNTAVVTSITGGNLWDNDMENKAAETWVAECRANGNLTATGIVLLVVAITFMIGGVVAEILAKRFVKRTGKVLGEEDGSSSGVFSQPNTSSTAAVLTMGAGWRTGESSGRKSE